MISCQTGGLNCTVKDQQTYTTTDAFVITNVAYITTFSLTCPSESDNLVLFAQLPRPGQIVPVTKSADGKKYQVSWTEELTKAPTGDQVIQLYDAAGYAALLKAKESGSVDAAPLATVTVNHRGTYKGPLIPIEFLAVVGIVSVGYLAFSAKSKIFA